MTNRRPYPNIWPKQIPAHKTQAENVLIIDSSSLGDLANPIPKTFFNKEEGIPLSQRPGSYLETLKHLPPKAVGKILIPDIVALESAGFSTLQPRRGGKTFLWRIDPPQEKESYNLSQRQKFIQDVIDGKVPNTEIVHSPHTFHYVQNMKRAYRALQRVSDMDGKPRQGCEEAFERAQKYFHRLKEQNGGFDRGEEHCVQLAMDYAAKYDATVTVMSEDIWGRGLLKKRVEVFHDYRQKKFPGENGGVRPQDEMRIFDINSLGYLKAMIDPGILSKEAGVHPTVTVESCQHAINTHERNRAILKVQNKIEHAARNAEVNIYEEVDPHAARSEQQAEQPHELQPLAEKAESSYKGKAGVYFKKRCEALAVPFEEKELSYGKKQYVHDAHHHTSQKTFVDFVAKHSRRDSIANSR